MSGTAAGLESTGATTTAMAATASGLALSPSAKAEAFPHPTTAVWNRHCRHCGGNKFPLARRPKIKDKFRLRAIAGPEIENGCLPEQQ
jgi:hypothetical protein